MDDDPYEPPTSFGEGAAQPGAGWTPLKILGVIVSILGVGGFGLCGVIGILVHDPSSLFLGIFGLVIAAFLLAGVLAIVRSARRPPSLPP